MPSRKSLEIIYVKLSKKKSKKQKKKTKELRDNASKPYDKLLFSAVK